MGYKKGMELLMSSNDDITIFHNPHILKSQLNKADKCLLKILWTSPQATPCSFAFPKESPIFPFFNAVYTQLVETGITNGYYKRWVKSEAESFCNSSEISGITLKKTTLLFVVLGTGLFFSFLLLGAEILRQKSVGNLLIPPGLSLSRKCWEDPNLGQNIPGPSVYEDPRTKMSKDQTRPRV